LGFKRAQESYIVTSTAQVTAPGLFGNLSFCGLKKLLPPLAEGGNKWCMMQPNLKYTQTECTYLQFALEIRLFSRFFARSPLLSIHIRWRSAKTPQTRQKWAETQAIVTQ